MVSSADVAARVFRPGQSGPLRAPAVSSVQVSAPRQDARGSPHALWLYLHLPHFALEVLTRGLDSDAACVLVSGQGRQRRVLLASRRAAAMGIRPDMPIGAAHALGQLRELEPRPDLQQRALHRLCLWAMQFTPQVSPSAADGLVLEIGGSQKLFGGLEGLLQQVRRGLRQLGYRVDYAVAPTPLAAGLLARTTPRRTVTDRARLAQALGRLPLSALRLEPAHEQALNSFGARNIADCRRLPRDGLARRLSPAVLHTLDRLLGTAPDPVTPFTAPRRFEAELELPWEVDNTRALTIAGERLIGELIGYLRANSGITDHLRWHLVDTAGALRHFDIRLTQASRDEAHMCLLLRETLARINLEAPVRAVGVSVTDITLRTVTSTPDLFTGHEQAEEGAAYAAFVDRLRSRCGNKALRCLGIRSVHNPERACFLQRPVEIAERKITGLAHQQCGRIKRPLWLLRRALRLSTRDGLPVFDGPLKLMPDRERLLESWWDETQFARDYFVATTRHHGRLWIYRELGGDQQWYLQGIFD